MRKVVMAAAAAGLLLAPSAANAAITSNVCATSASPAGYYACASITLSFSGTQIIMDVKNIDGWQISDPSNTIGYALTGVGFKLQESIAANVTGLAGVALGGSATAVGGATGSDWTFSKSFSNINVDGGAATTSGVNSAIAGCLSSGISKYFNTCPEGAYIRFTFDTNLNADPFAGLEEGELGFGLRGQSGPGGASFKCEDFDTQDPDCIPTTTVPEPLSVMLLGTGLVGVGGALRRRRNRRNDVTNA